MSNAWNIKITESNSPKGFLVAVDNNGEYVGGIRGVIHNFDKAVSAGKDIVMSHIKFKDTRNKRVFAVNDMFIKKFIHSGHYNGVYNSVVKVDEKGSPYLEVTMNTDNSNLDKLIPDVVTDPKTKYDYRVVKVKPLSGSSSSANV
jgi:hypothetical protein